MKILSFFIVPSFLVLFWIFFKIGLIFFGGGYVVLSIIHRELVGNLHLLTEKEFVDGTAISQLTPGPVAILATFAGYKIAGIWGALVSTFAMFLPGSTLMFFLSKSYDKIRNSNFAYKILNTIVPVIVGLLLAISLQIGHSTMNSPLEYILFLASLVLFIKYKMNPAILILSSAVIGLVLHF